MIARVFRTGLGRTPEPDALRSFGAMMRRGAALIDVAHAVAGSAEFRALHGPDESCDEAFVARLFNNGLGRDPDPHGLANLVGAPSRAEALAAVAGSDEARDRIALLDELFPDGAPPGDPLAYAVWVERQLRPGEEDRLRIGEQIDAMEAPPRISLLTIAAPTRPDLLDETLQSLAGQLYPHWELAIACPYHLPPAVRRRLSVMAARVPGIVLAEPPAEASVGDLWGAALAVATGTFVAFLDPGDRLAETALYEMAAALTREPMLDLLYSDEDSIEEGGGRFAPLFKPGWSPDGLLAGDVIGQLALMRRERVVAVGGIRSDGGAQARYDLLLRFTEGLFAGAIEHLPAVLFHRGRQPGRKLPFPRSRNTTSHPDVVNTVARHLAETAQGTEVVDVYIGGDVWPHARFPLPANPPLVSVLIPTRDQPELLEACVAGLLGRTDYPALEVVIADNGSRNAGTLDLLRRLARDPRVRVETIDIEFNWSTLNNRLAAVARGDVLVLMNDDVDVIGSDWLHEMVRQILRPKVGIVGPRLLYQDGSLQHGGIVLSATAATHVLRSARDEEPGYLGQIALARDLSAVTGACLAIRREVFEALGGADESFDMTCNDVDLCLRARAAGWRVVWTPHAVLEHRDGATRGHDRTFAQLTRFWRDLRRLHDRWPDEMAHDPFLNANLVATDHHLVLAPTARRGRPWMALDDAEQDG